MLRKIAELYREKQEFLLLEAAYATVAVASFIIAAIVALFNQAFGIAILIIPIIMLVMLVVNIVAWSLVRLFVDAAEKREGDSKGKSLKK